MHQHPFATTNIWICPVSHDGRLLQRCSLLVREPYRHVLSEHPILYRLSKQKRLTARLIRGNSGCLRRNCTRRELHLCQHPQCVRPKCLVPQCLRHSRRLRRPTPEVLTASDLKVILDQKRTAQVLPRHPAPLLLMRKVLYASPN